MGGGGLRVGGWEGRDGENPPVLVPPLPDQFSPSLMKALIQRQVLNTWKKPSPLFGKRIQSRGIFLFSSRNPFLNVEPLVLARTEISFTEAGRSSVALRSSPPDFQQAPVTTTVFTCRLDFLQVRGFFGSTIFGRNMAKHHNTRSKRAKMVEMGVSVPGAFCLYACGCLVGLLQLAAGLF